jgi:hypothetical protein
MYGEVWYAALGSDFIEGAINRANEQTPVA